MARPSSKAWKYGPNGVTSYPCCLRFSSRMMLGGISDITYEYVVTLISGWSGNGALVSAAPPVLPRASSTTVRAPSRAKYAPLVRPL